ncbi:MAG: fused signal recognition particle receptor [Patescibacteria group bacterium]|jgi:fused signal recognition particle receptor
MFGALKNKLKSWISSSTEEPTEGIKEEVNTETKIEETPVEKASEKKPETKKKPIITKEEVNEKTPEPKIQIQKQKKVEEIKPKIQEAPKPQKLGFFQKALTQEKFEEIFDELELILLQNNVAYAAVEQIKESLGKELIGDNAKVNIEEALKSAIRNILINPPSLLDQIKEKENKPFIIMFAGINGAGKTTTIAKIANYLLENKLTVALAAGDTFRAAAIEQLATHANNLKIPIIKKEYGSDPASVGYDAVKYAEKNNIDVVLVDTAGRMNNRDALMREIEKIAKVTKPDLKIFLGESITGNDATNQAKDFNDSIELDGIILSKADVDEKGGTAISVSQVTGKPIYFLGTGQNYENLEEFNKENLIKKIFE